MNPAQFIARFQRIKWLQPSVIALVTANLVPLAALFVFHWDVFSLLFLFWLENVIIGVLNVMRMLLAGTFAKDLPPHGWIIFWATKLFMIPFFCVHYGMFTFAHGMFIVGIFDKGALQGFHGFGFPLIFQVIHDNHLEWPFAALAGSHLISFVWDYILSGEFRHTNPMTLMMQPYRRVIVMHITVIVGAFLTMALHLPEAVLILLVVLKTATDLWSHQNEREKLAANKPLPSAIPSMPDAPSLPPLQNTLQAAMQARAAQAGQAGQPIPPRAVAVLAITFIGAFSFVCFVSYQLISPIFSFGQPHAASPPPAAAAARPVHTAPAAHWTLDLRNVEFPKTRAAGKFRGDNFSVEHAVIDKGNLDLRQGSGTNSRVVVIMLHLAKDEVPAGRSYQIFLDGNSIIPEVRLVRHENDSKKTTDESFTNGYAMRLDLGGLNQNKIPAKIYLCLPDEQKSFLAGTFNIPVKKDRPPPDPADN